MAEVTRLTPFITHSDNAAMTPHANGNYISYASHQKEMSRLQTQIDALVEVQKRKILEPIENMLSIELVNMAIQATIQVYKVNPVDASVAEAVIERANHALERSGVISVTERVELDAIASPGGFAIGGFVQSVENAIVGGLSPGGSIHNVINDNTKGLLCIKSDCKSFSAGESYDYETKGGKLFLAQDDFVSSLCEDDYWRVTDGGAYHIVETLAGNAYFKKP